jgi:hypothetical protein
MANPLGRALYRLSQSARVAWFGGHHILANRLGRKTAFAEEGVRVGSRYPDRKLFLGEMQKLFERDWKNIEDGLYAAPAALDRAAVKALRNSVDFLRDVPEVARRRRDHVHDEVKAEEPRQGMPDYYMQNFHFQSGGWLTEDSAKRYDFQVETLFGGTADAMRRQALVPIAQYMKGRDQRTQTLLDVATGTGRFLTSVKDNWPKLNVTALDLSDAYLKHAPQGTESLAGRKIPRSQRRADAAAGRQPGHRDVHLSVPRTATRHSPGRREGDRPYPQARRPLRIRRLHPARRHARLRSPHRILPAGLPRALLRKLSQLGRSKRLRRRRIDTAGNNTRLPLQGHGVSEVRVSRESAKRSERAKDELW